MAIVLLNNKGPPLSIAHVEVAGSLVLAICCANLRLLIRRKGLGVVGVSPHLALLYFEGVRILLLVLTQN